eukprot:scaffold35694_cov20-Tisochrysis_lutea.AAC.2
MSGWPCVLDRLDAMGGGSERGQQIGRSSGGGEARIGAVGVLASGRPRSSRVLPLGPWPAPCSDRGRFI